MLFNFSKSQLFTYRSNKCSYQNLILFQSHVFCISCEKSFCKDCLAKHKENPVFSSHSTINISRRINGNTFSDLLNNNCELHQKEILKYVCVTCNQAVCTLCVMNKHPKHDVQPVEQFLKNKSILMKTLLSEVGSKKDDLKKQLEELEPARLASEQACLESEKAIKKRSEMLINEVKRKEADMMAQIKKVRERQLAPINKEMERIKFHLTKVKAIEQMADDKNMSLSKSLSTYPTLIQRMQTLLEVDFIPDQNYIMSNSALKFIPGSNQLGFGSVDKDTNSPRSESTPENPFAEQAFRRSSKIDIIAENKTEISERKNSKYDITSDVKPLSGNLRRGSKYDATPEVNKMNPLKKSSKTFESTPEHKIFSNPFRRTSKVDTTPDVKSNNPFKKQPSVGFSSTVLTKKIFAIGSQPGEINQAIWVAEMGKNTFAVSDFGNKRIQVFQVSGKVFSIISECVNPMGIAVTSKRNIIVADCVLKLMQVFSPEGKVLSKWGHGKFYSPCDVAVCPNGDLIISDIGNNSVSLYRNEEKKVLSLGGSDDPLFKMPRFVTAGPNNEIIVSDCKDHKVKVFDCRGQMLCRFGGEGCGDGEFSSPNGVCVMNDVAIVVADTGNNRICKFSMSGMFLEHFQVEVSSPRGLAQVGSSLVVTEFDSSNGQCSIKVFSV